MTISRWNAPNLAGKVVKNVQILGLFVLLLVGCTDEARTPGGVLVPDDPVQEMLSSTRVFVREGYTIRPMARFHVTARVLGTERYRFGREADLSPVDLALGWGPMSDQKVLDQIEISQSRRFYRWRVRHYPIPRRDIIRHSANMHIIPADEDVEKDLLAVRAGEIVEIDGYLVSVSAADGWYWRSSLTRNDTGNGACELVFAERIVSYPVEFRP